MAKLKITRANGEVSEHRITPGIEYAFELVHRAGISKELRETEKQTSIFWLAWEALRRSGATVPTFGPEFVDTLESVEVLEEKKQPQTATRWLTRLRLYRWKLLYRLENSWKWTKICSGILFKY